MFEGPPTSVPLHALWLGRRDYRCVLSLQMKLFEARKVGQVSDVVLFVEHSPVVTMGRGAKQEHLLAPAETLRAQGIDCVEVDRGGDVTLHLPGQLVAYPIVQLTGVHQDVRRYVGSLRQAMADVIRPWGIEGGGLDGLVGLWVDSAAPGAWRPGGGSNPAKVGAIGVRLSRWVTLHGYALNLDPDMSLFRWIVPCGVRDYPVTSVAQLLGFSRSPAEVWPDAHRALAQALEREPMVAHDLSALAELDTEVVLGLVGQAPSGSALVPWQD